MRKKLIINTLLYTVLPKLPVLASLFVLPLITPYLTLNDYGRYGLIIAYYSAFAMFVTLGQNVILQNSYFEHGKYFNLVWSRAYGIMTAGSIFISIILAVIFFFLLGSRFSSEYWLVTGMFVIALLCSPIDTIAQVFYVMREQPMPLAIRSIIMGILNATVVFVTIKYFKLGYIGWVIGMAVNGVVSLGFYLYPICIKNCIYPMLYFKKEQARAFLRVGLPLLPHSLSMYIFNTSDRVLLDFFKVSVRDIGLYSQGYGLGANGMVLMNGLFSALGRTLQEGFRNKTAADRQKLRKLVLITVFGTGVLFFNCALWMKEIYLFLFRNPELQTGYPVAMIVIMSYAFFSLYNFAAYPLIIKSRTKMIAYISMCAAIANLALNVIFIPMYGIWTTLCTTYLSFIIWGIVGVFVKDAHTELAWLFPRITRVYILFVLYGVIITCLAWLLRDIFWMGKLIISGLSCVSAWFAWKYLAKSFF